MEYKIALDPSLDLKTEEFVERWNSSEEHHKVAKAHLEEGKGELLDPYWYYFGGSWWCGYRCNDKCTL